MEKLHFSNTQFGIILNIFCYVMGENKQDKCKNTQYCIKICQ